MNKLVFIVYIISIVITLLTNSCNTDSKVFYENGKLKARYYTIEDTLYYEEYYDNENLKIITPNINLKLNGLVKEYNFDGSIKYIKNYIDNKLDGWTIFYNRDNRKKEELYYINGNPVFCKIYTYDKINLDNYNIGYFKINGDTSKFLGESNYIKNKFDFSKSIFYDLHVDKSRLNYGDSIRIFLNIRPLALERDIYLILGDFDDEYNPIINNAPRIKAINYRIEYSYKPVVRGLHKFRAIVLETDTSINGNITSITERKLPIYIDFQVN